GSAELIVEFDDKTMVEGDLTYVNQAIAQSALPSNVNVVAKVINPNVEPVISYAITSKDMSQTLLHEIATNSMLPRFYGVPGMARATVTGGPAREYRIALNPGALATYGLTADDVSNAIAQV